MLHANQNTRRLPHYSPPDVLWYVFTLGRASIVVASASSGGVSRIPAVVKCAGLQVAAISALIRSNCSCRYDARQSRMPLNTKDVKCL